MRKSQSAGSARRAGRGGVADERRNRARGASDDDVLRGRALEPARVHEDVEEVSDECEHRGEHVHRGREERERDRGEQDPELERLLGRDAAGGDGPRLGPAPHEGVDVAVEQVVQRGGASACERQAEHGDREEAERRDALGADEHPGRAGQEQERHDPRLRQRQVVARRGERRRRSAQGARDDEEREAEGRRGGHSDVQRHRPRRIAAPRDDASERDRDEERDERGDRSPRAGRDRRSVRRPRSRPGAGARRERGSSARHRARRRR